MNEFVDWFMQGDIGTDFTSSGGNGGGVQMTLIVVLISLALGHVIGWTYMLTHRGVSYSQGFATSLVILPIIVAFIMKLMASNFVIALGLLAVFAMVRFRNVLKDTRDTTFILWAIACGMGVGTFHFSSVIAGCLCVALILFYLRVTAFGQRQRYDVVLNVELNPEGNGMAEETLLQILRRHSARMRLASRRIDTKMNKDLSYRLLLRDPSRQGDLVTELEGTKGINRVSLFEREDEVEI